MITAGTDLAWTVTSAVGALVPPPTLAVTLASTLVVSCVRASPAVSEMAVAEDNVPNVVEKVTAAPRSGLPPVSTTVATISVVPPVDGTIAGLARAEIAPAAAEPTRISRSSDLFPPENAPTLAVPDWLPEL